MQKTFDGLIPNKSLLDSIKQAGFKHPTPVQELAIPEIINGHDLYVRAQTGSGKTAAFLLPTILKITQQKSIHSGIGPRALILVPTRELAHQIEQNIKLFSTHAKWLRYTSLIGGMSYTPQIRYLSKPIDIIIATPGRLLDHIKQGRIDFQRLETLILDEADRMLDMGFIDDIKHIVKLVPEDRQTLLFSATLDKKIKSLITDLTTDAHGIDIEKTERTGKIDEFIYYCDDFRHKLRILQHLLKNESSEQVIIFTSTKVMTEELADILDEDIPCDFLHGDLPQHKRSRILKNFHNGRSKILVATDVAARGIDISDITHVYNFDLPKQAEDYVHRIGRTGRAGKSGTAISLAETKELVKVHRIEKLTGHKITESEIPGLESTKRHKKPNRNNQKRFGQAKPTQKRKPQPKGSQPRSSQPRNTQARKKGFQNKKSK